MTATHSRSVRIGLSVALVALLVGAPPAAQASAVHPCGAPISRAAKPTVTDALAILKSAVGGPECDALRCLCDIDGKAGVSAVDAQTSLVASVGLIEDLECPCDARDLACTSISIHTAEGSTASAGWTGVGANALLPVGHLLDLAIASRCTDDGSLCEDDTDCPGAACVPTCDCITDPDCELIAPREGKRCLLTGIPCSGDADCGGGACRVLFGAPRPVSAGGNPTCNILWNDGELAGSFEAGSGNLTLDLPLHERFALGIALHQPCPSCGRPDQAPRLGDTFACQGGRTPGATCTVDAVHPVFGGTSFDCMPSVSSGILHPDQHLGTVRLDTGATTRTAQLPCANFLFNSHPSRGNGVCPDSFTECTSNADCMRCTGDPTTACTDDEQCAGKGSCAEAPDQPVTCGFWCHCGTCDNDAARPCFEDGECKDGGSCRVGTGTHNTPSSPQRQPNECTNDNNICGMTDTETCAETMQGTCSLQPFRSCTDSETCAANGAGTCEFAPRACFEPRIVRAGLTSPLGSYCRDARTPCTTNADCAPPPCPDEGDCDDTCETDIAVPDLAALYCRPAHSSSTINSASGFTGPAALHLRTTVEVCTCGDGVIGCGEQCDDGNVIAGDGCDPRCRIE
jgi:cysteine-rich repeat protein